MSIRIYNENTKRWELQTSLNANNIVVRDTLGNFNSPNKTVESCLEETQATLDTIKKDIKYIYENGTIGGGSGGGGGSAFPKIELISSSEIIVKTNNTFTVSFFFSSPNPGDGTINFTLTKKNSTDLPILDIKKTVKQGRVNYTFDPIPSGEYQLSLSAIDSTGVGSNNIICNITCGALELSTNEEESQDVQVGSVKTITYKIDSIFKENIDVEITKPDGTVIQESKKAGTYSIKLEPFESLGVKKLTIKATCNNVESNTLNFLFIVTDASNMFMSTTFTGGTFRTDENVSINYRISLLGARNFLTDVYINNQLHEENVQSKNGHNFYVLNNLPVGRYRVTFKSKTLETVNPIKAEITVPEFEIVSATFRSYNFSKDSLLVSLDARKGKSNNQSPEKREVWEDTETGKPTITTLHNFAFNFLNGWTPKSDTDLTVEGLKFSGKSYAEINLKPLSNKLTNGLTVEVRYKALDIGADSNGNYSCIFDCFERTKTTGKGILIDSKEAVARTSYANSIYSEYNNDEWVTQTFVINKPKNEMVLYTNGSISSYAKVEDAADLLVNKIITLGARNENGEISQNANCVIQTVRIYDRALNDLEVFKNYVSDLPLEKQDEIISMQEGQLQIPTLKLKFDESALGSASATTTVDIEYSDPSDPSKNLILYNSIIQKQGTTSLTYPVSNYTLKLYEGGLPFDYTPKDDWIPENIFTLKADYMDSSHANNTGIAAYASEVFKRLGIKNLAQKENDKVKNTIDGFMINLYINGVDRGLYNFNTDRFGAKNYGLSSTKFKTTALSYEANSNTGNATGFHTQDFNKIKSAFKVRYFKGETDSSKYLTYDKELGENVLTQGVHNEFVSLIKWINEAGTEAVEGKTERFYSEFKEHLDLDHTLLYMLTVEIFGLMDNLEKNMVLTYFGEQYNEQTGMVDEIWYPQLYDLDSSVGLSNNGELKYQPCVNFTQEEGMPLDHKYNGTTSLLWSAVKKMFATELRDMYASMRRTGLLSFEILMEFYQGKTIDKVSPYLYSKDSRIKYIQPSASGGKDTYYHFCKGRRIEFTKKWLKSRIQFLDSIYEYGNENNPDGNFWKYIQARYLRRNDIDTTFTIKAKSTTPLFLIVVDDSMKTDGKKYFVSNDKLYDITIPINSSSDGAMFGITFGPNLTELQFSDNIRLSSLYLEHARSLYELNIPNNKELTNIVLNNCDNLRKFNVSGCSKLGSVKGTEQINFSNCPNIKEINIEGTAVSGFLVNEKGGVIEKLNCNKSNIETFILKNQSYIDSLNILECRNLKKFELENCENVTSVNLPSSIIETFRLLDCPKISTVNISNTPFLNGNVDASDLQGRNNFLIDNCPNLTSLTMSGLTNQDMTLLDLINVENIQYLDISRCSYLSEIRFSEAANKLSTFICNDSSIKNFKIGRSGVTTDELDLGHFPNITNANFDNCVNLRKIINSNLGKNGAINGSTIFRNCSQLTEIVGSLSLKGALTQGFYNCSKLKKLPDNIDLSGVTSASQAFQGCRLLTTNEAKRIMSKLINLSGSTWLMFSGCSGITSSSSSKFPSDFFANNAKLTQLNQIFSGCSGIKGEFPNDLFKPLVNLNYVYSPFSGASFEVPLFGQDDIFSTCTKLETLIYPFSGFRFVRLPTVSFFKNCPKLKVVEHLFENQENMIKSSDAGEYFIGERFFVNNPLIENISYTFNNCTSLDGKIPPTLFINNKKIIYAQYTFKNCKLTGSIPSGLLPVDMVNGIKTSHLINTRGMFENSTIDGSIEETLLAEHNNISDMSYMFSGCVNLGTNIDPTLVKFPNKIFRNKKGLTTIEGMFKGCSNYPITFDSNNVDDSSLLADNVNLSGISYLFSGCTSLTGTLPQDIFNIKDKLGEYLPNKISNAIGVFENTNISGVIPSKLFKSFINVRSLDRFFSNCKELEGGIPYNLFSDCINLVSASYFLSMPWDSSLRKIGTNRNNSTEKHIDEATGFKYIFNKQLFANCPKLEDLSGFLHSAGQQYDGKLHPETFANNYELKNIESIFANTGLSFDLTREVFLRNKKITKLEDAFRSTKGPNTIEIDSFDKNVHNYTWRDQDGRIIVKDFGGTFAHCNIIGMAPKLWEMFPDSIAVSDDGIKCFSGAKVTNIDSVPPTWK